MEVNLNAIGTTDRSVKRLKVRAFLGRNVGKNEIFPHKSLPQDNVSEIFKKLDMRDLGRCKEVSRTWYQLAENPIFSRNAIYRDIAINPQFWNEIFGTGTVSEEEMEEAFYLLPLSIFETLKSFSVAFPDKRTIKSHTLFWIPKTIRGKLLTINSFGSLLKEKHEFSETVDGYRYMWKSIKKDEGEKLVESGWILMTTDLLPGSRGLLYKDQKILVETLNKNNKTAWRVPKLAEAIICTYAEYFKSGKFLFNKNPLSYTRCLENVREGQTFVGGFEEEGLDIHNFNFYAHQSIGVATAWKL